MKMITWLLLTRRSAVFAAAIALGASLAEARAAAANGPVAFDLAPSAACRVVRVRDAKPLGEIETPGRPFRLEDGQVLVMEWTQPRDVRAVALEFEPQAPAADEIAIEWWRRVWPDNGSGGWMKLDDPFNGGWARAKCSASTPSRGLIRFEFAPLETNEAPGIKRTGFIHRHTYKLRISMARPVVVRRVAAFSDAVERRARVRFEWDLKTSVAGQWSPKFEARNGRIVQVAADGKTAAIVEVAYADTPNRLSGDRGVLLLRSGPVRSFAVFVDDVLRAGGLLVRDLGVFVSDAERAWTHATWPGPGGEAWKDGTIAEQVANLPEQSFESVMKAIPPKPPTYLFLGAPNLRQEFGVGPKGEIILRADSLRTPGPDLARRPWSWEELTLQIRSTAQADFAAKDGRQVTRSLQDAWLPVARHEWQEGELGFNESCVATPLVGDIGELQSTNGCEPLALVARFSMTNSAHTAQTAHLWLRFSHPSPCRLESDGVLGLNAPSDGTNRPGLTPVRGRFNRFDKGRVEWSASAAALHYQIELEPGEGHAAEFALTYIELLDEREVAALRRLAFQPACAATVRFWQERVSRGMTYEVPERFLNEFFKANLWHVLISTDIDPVTGHYQHGAATHHYKNYLNETAMVARSLEMRGEHAEAQRLLQPFIDCQGVRPLPGNFKSKAGVFYAAHPTSPDPYTAQGYNMHHGFGLWALAEHFFWTRDTNYVESIRPRLAAGCDWVARERQATKVRRGDGARPIEYGLPPAGDLEDVEEYLYWYATAAYYYLGMKRAAEAVAQTASARTAPGQESPRRLARRMASEAASFLEDIQASVAESVATTPVVRLRDGTWVPFVPPRAYALTHLAEGWIREGLYPALHLWCGEVYPPNHPYVDWMIQDLEDNIFLSKESGYGVDNARTNFFNFGGFTLQPNLVDLPLLYLQRDQVANCLRGFYNTCWASLYPDAMCFAEWVPYYGKGGGPLFKTPDECKFIQWMRSMLILELGDRLELGLGVPRAWMADGKRVKVERAATFFGKVDLLIESQAAKGRLRGQVRLERALAPASVWLRLRHPEGKLIQSARVNGQPARVNAERQLIELPAGVDVWQVDATF